MQVVIIRVFPAAPFINKISDWSISIHLISDWLAGSEDDKMSSSLESMREAALSIYQEYLSDKANPRIELDESLNKKLLLRIRSETPDPTWFDEVGSFTHDYLERTDKYVRDFKRSVGYLKLLAELDLLKGELEDDEELSIRSVLIG